MGKQGPCCHCGVTSTPLWRNGPPEKPILCNACGSRWRTKGSLTNYTPMHAREPIDSEELKVTKAKSTSLKSKEQKLHKKKQSITTLGSEREIPYSDQNFRKIADGDTSNRSSSGSAISYSESCAHFGTTDASDMTEFERNGVNLTMSKRKELEKLRSQIDELSLRYIQNLNGDNSFILFSEPELAGMPPQFIKSLEETDSAKLKVFLKSYHVTPILEHCKIGSTRKLVAVAYGQRCGKENLDILENLVQLRHKFARLLGYSNYADFAIEPRMARTSSKVFEFLEDVSVKVSDLATRELSVLRDLKRKDEGDSPFGMEDLLYYMRRVEEEQLDLDLGEVKQYFPVNLVLSGIFKIFQDLFGLRFEEIKDVDVWHETVCLYSVLDYSSSELLGYFYLDIFSREGKFAHTCVLPLQNGCLSSNGTHQIPVVLLISQYPKEIDGKPVLLRFSEVVSLFHEFSHAVHHICSRATFSRFSALRVEADFVEIPAHILENWCYESISLKMMSGFHQDITKSVTSEMCKSLKRRREMFSGLKLKQEILLCLVDQIIHSNENVDMVELLKHLHPKVMLGIPLLEGTNPASCFPRIAIGYEAVCYSDVWSEVFAADIFASKFQDDLLNKYAGLQFRNKVLAPGGAKEPLEILSDYLGREPSIQSFVECKSKNNL